MSDELAILLGKRFLQRRDVKAVQFQDGHYEPDRSPWKMSDLRSHVSGERTLGHYLIDKEGLCKLFAFDIDLTKEGYWIDLTDGRTLMEGGQPCNPRELWLEPNHPSKEFFLLKLRCTAEVLGRKIKALFGDDLHVAISLSGGKGMHVYALSEEPMPASEARRSALLVLKSVNDPGGKPGYEPVKGENFWKSSGEGEKHCVEIEVFPKQDSLDGKDLGNLMRLPLGVHRKTNQTSYFLDFRCGYNQIRMMDPTEALEGELPWE